MTDYGFSILNALVTVATNKTLPVDSMYLYAPSTRLVTSNLVCLRTPIDRLTASLIGPGAGLARQGRHERGEYTIHASDGPSPCSVN